MVSAGARGVGAIEWQVQHESGVAGQFQAPIDQISGKSDATGGDIYALKKRMVDFDGAKGCIGPR